MGTNFHDWQKGVKMGYRLHLVTLRYHLHLES